MSIAVERCGKLDADDAGHVAAIYEASFPASERDDTSELLADLASGRRHGYVARDDGAVVGLAVASTLDGTGVAFLEYLAVAEDRRNAGVGGLLLDHLRDHLAAETGASGIVLEVEPPWEATGEERALRERRIGFYLRHGAVVVECAPRYRAPDLADADRLVPYSLLWVPLGEQAPASLEGDLLRRCVRAILIEAYELEAADPLVEEVVGDLAC